MISFESANLTVLGTMTKYAKEPGSFQQAVEYCGYQLLLCSCNPIRGSVNGSVVLLCIHI